MAFLRAGIVHVVLTFHRIGAVLASVATNADIGTNVMIFGISLQVVTLALFGGMAIDVWLRMRKHSGQLNQGTDSLRSSKHFRNLLVALIIAYSTIMIRCIYRIAEM